MQPGAPGPSNNRTGLMVVAVIAAVAVITALVVVVLVKTRADSTASGSTSGTAAAPSGELKAIHIASPTLRTKPGSDQPLATLTVYEDFLCPFCGLYEHTYGPAVAGLVDSGQLAVDYKIVSVLGRHSTTSYSVRSGAMAYCVADADRSAFLRFHAALFANQPDEGASTFPSDDQLLAQARKAGAGDAVADCVHKGTYLDMVNKAVSIAKIEGTPTLELNGKDIADDLMSELDPQVLTDKVDAITGGKR